MDLAARLRTVEQLSPADRLDALAALGREVLADDSAGAPANGSAADVIRPLVAHLLDAIESGAGTGRQRLELGEVLGLLGDPRLRRPADEGYWVRISSDLGPIVIGRFPVTNAEYRAWVDSGAYRDRSAWTDDGWTWLDGAKGDADGPWSIHAQDVASRPFVVPNQPVVGVTFWEAQAYAAAHGARLPRSDERVWACRGRERRPYPWGSPFGEGNANTREEVLGRPCAVGLYLRDRTPDGVADLAGNVAEWMADEVGDQRLIHPGAWDQPSMAAWAKALALYPPDARWAGLGFRLARDA
ncbi:MAG: SUMF1/EgtB/PvdO family nonheme iron enzyme [Myxococcota bacterium]